MPKYKIAILPGDGIGKEVIEAAKIVLKKIDLNAEYIYGDIGWEFWCKEGEALPERTIKLLRNVDVALFGAITSKPQKVAEEELSNNLKGKGFVYTSPIVRMRQIFDLYICLRPCKAYNGNPLNYREGIDIVIFRENIEDLYTGVEFYPVPKTISDAIYKNSKQFESFVALNPEEFAISCKINTKKGSYRLIKSAFEYAKKKGRKKITIVHKANVVRATDGLFLETAKEISKEYNEIAFEDVNIDALMMWLLKNPKNYDILVAPNLYGDIISDLCAQMVGGLGFAYSGNIGDNFAIFEPTHGSAPKYTGQYKVNPIATILAAKMMLEWLGEEEKAKIIEGAVEIVIKEGKVKTYDMGGKNSTIEMAEAIASRL